MKVTAFIGSGRKKHSYNFSEKFLQSLQSFGDVDYDMVMLSDYGDIHDAHRVVLKGES